MRTHNCFQHSNWVLIALPHGNRECDNPVQEKQHAKSAFKTFYLKQGETKDRKRQESFLEGLCHLPRILESKGSKDTKVPRGTEKSLLSGCHFTWICWSLLLFGSINLPVEHVRLTLLKGVLKEWNQDCPLYSLKNILQPPNQITWVVAYSCSSYLLGATQEGSVVWLNSSGSSIPLPDVVFWGRTLVPVVTESSPLSK